jgi:hypothetical protein
MAFVRLYLAALIAIENPNALLAVHRRVDLDQGGGARGVIRNR